MAIPVVADFQGNGRRQMLYGSSTYRLGLLDMEGNVIWQERQRSTPRIVPGVGEVPPGPFGSNVGNHSTPAILPAIGDADGDGNSSCWHPGTAAGSALVSRSSIATTRRRGTSSGYCRFRGLALIPTWENSPTLRLHPASADIDGDGREEAIFGIGNKLYAVGANRNGQAGEIRWTLEFPAPVGPPSIADVDGDGRAEIVVVCGDGHVYVVGPKQARG